MPLDKQYGRSYKYCMTYVQTIEPRLTPHRPSAPASTAEAIVEWTRDLQEELAARLALIAPEELVWQPHPDANSAGVTVWHVARWLDVLGTRVFTGRSKDHDVWHRDGWRTRTGYEPEGIGYLGLGTLTGYTPAQMRDVPQLSADDLRSYLARSAEALVERTRELADVLVQPLAGLDLSPYQLIGSTLQGSFGHVGEVDALVALRARWQAGAEVDQPA
jgi:hypothetical protein